METIQEVLPVLAGVLVGMMLMAYPLRLLSKRLSKDNPLNKIRKIHKWLGILTIAVVLSHCALADMDFDDREDHSGIMTEQTLGYETYKSDRDRDTGRYDNHRDDDDDDDDDDDGDDGKDNSDNGGNSNNNNDEHNETNENERDTDVIIANVIPFLMILLPFTWLFRKKLKKNWIVFHRILAAGVLISVLCHVIFEV